jgi:hypothetical protein
MEQKMQEQMEGAEHLEKEHLEKKGLKVAFGLEAQGHLPTIKRILDRWNEPTFEGHVDMTYSECVWREIGNEIGWSPFTAALSYFKYLNKKKQPDQ